MPERGREPARTFARGSTDAGTGAGSLLVLSRAKVPPAAGGPGLYRHKAPAGSGAGMQEGGHRGCCAPVSGSYVRRRPTLPPGPPGSTIGAERLSFRVRNETGRFPLAMTAVTL